MPLLGIGIPTRVKEKTEQKLPIAQKLFQRDPNILGNLFEHNRADVAALVESESGAPAIVMPELPMRAFLTNLPESQLKKYV